ncbi:oxidoreductase [Gallaecimonas mangrovi]|uniref:oxidoreductase n=1 Tax=Gallaecimonas mangrovi TaxID=2291597 RepID=UPI000E20A9EE|nr:NADH-dependent flavin oxidoreductase [Gallaecimonas mangrovi]
MSPKVNQPFVFNNGTEIRNPVVMAPMTTWAGNDIGELSEQELAYYRARAKEVGMVITATSHTLANGRGFPGQFFCGNDACLAQLTALAEAIHSGGAKAILQIFHAGRSTSPELSDDIVSASAIPERFQYHTNPREISEAEMLQLLQSFAEVTHRAITAGFDGIEIHGANGYLFQQFLSAATNQRSDDWGGTLEKRCRFPLAAVDTVIKAAAEAKRPDFIIGYRLTPEEVPEIENGLTLQEAAYFVDQLATRALSYLHISLQHYRQTSRRNPGSTEPVAEGIAKVLAGRLALVGVGQVKTADELADALRLYDLVAVGRALITDPHWLSKVQAAKPLTQTVSATSLNAQVIPPLMFEQLKTFFPDITSA